MADRKQAQRILEALPPQELKALEELGTWHESASAAPGFKPEERAQLLALIDEAAQPRLKKLSRDYLGAARVQQNLMWLRIHDYWHHAAQSWLRALEPKPLPEAAAGAVRALGQQLKWQQLRYGPVDLAVWGHMNRACAVAEAQNMAAAKAEFLKAALFSASAMDSRLPPEIDLAERLIEMLAPAFALERAAAAELPYWIDLARPMAPARSKQPPQPGAGLRFIGPGTALAKLKDLISKVERHFETPAELKLGAVDADMLLVVMRHLAAHWAPVPPERRHKRMNVSSSLKITHGFDGVVEALGGASDSLDFGGGAVKADRWTVENVSAGGFGARAPQAKNEWLKVGALVAAWPEGAPGWMVGTVRRVNKVSQQEMRVGVETLSRAPALSQFARPRNGATQGVLLPGTSPGDASIAMKAGVYERGENLEATIEGRQLVYLPQGTAERGDDYEIVRFREMIRE